MRILLVTDWTEDEGGIEVYLTRLRDELTAMGDDVALLTSSAGSAASGSAEYVAFSSDRALLQTGLQVVNPRARATLRRAVDAFRPAVIYVNMFEKYLSPTVLRPPGGVPVVTMVQYYKPICPTALKLLPGGAQCLYREGYVCVRSGCIGAAEWLRDRPRYRLIRSGLSAARVLACSEWLARELVASGIDAEPLHLPVPAPLPGFRRSPAPRPVFVFAGRLKPEKGPDLLVAAFARTLRRHPGARLRILGDGPGRAALEQQVRSLGVGGTVDFLGRLPFRGVEAQLEDAWALVSPSRWAEPFGLAAVEAITRGVPAVASAAGGHAETIDHGVNGLLYRNGDLDGLAGCLEAIASGRAFPGSAVPDAAVARLRRRHDVRLHAVALREIFATAVRNPAA
jgi:glycosyltransferase involved in cell wall biosynthesis